MKKYNANGEEIIDIVVDGGISGRVSTDLGMVHIFQIMIPAFGLLQRSFIEASLTQDHLTILRAHAKAFACLDGNAFGPSTEHSYVDIAYANLWNNGALDDIPNLYPCTPTELDWAQMDPDNSQYSTYLSNMNFYGYDTSPERRDFIKSCVKSVT